MCPYFAPSGAFRGRTYPAVTRGGGLLSFMSRRSEKSPSASSAAAHTSLVVLPGAREAFTPRELVSAYEDFVRGEPQYLYAETGIEASAYRFGTRVLLVYEETETGAIVLIHPTS
jgi:hypothetical protein